MIKIGEYQDLEIVRQMPQGYYLMDREDEDEVLLPNAYVDENMQIGDMVKVFVYCDSSGREMATTEKPILTVGQYALLTVSSVTKVGAFCEWGTSKELLIPFHNQSEQMIEGETYVVYMYLDDVTDRLVGSTKLNRHLQLQADGMIKVGQEVDLLVINETAIGYKVVVNQKYAGLVYKNESTETLLAGQELTGYVKPIRPDKKIDISLSPIGFRNVEANVQKILDALEAGNGFLPYHDKSDPQEIQAALGMSKKLFKKVVGSLYKAKRIMISDSGIRKIS